MLLAGHPPDFLVRIYYLLLIFSKLRGLTLLRRLGPARRAGWILATTVVNAGRRSLNALLLPAPNTPRTTTSSRPSLSHLSFLHLYHAFVTLSQDTYRQSGYRHGHCYGVSTIHPNEGEQNNGVQSSKKRRITKDNPDRWAGSYQGFDEDSAHAQKVLTKSYATMYIDHLDENKGKCRKGINL